MNRRTTAIAVLIAGVAICFLLWRGGARIAPPAPTVAPRARLVSPRVRPAAESAPIRLQSATAIGDPFAPNGAFEGRVMDWGSTRGVDGAEVTFSHGGTTASVVTSQGGRFQFEPAEPGSYTLALVTAPKYLPFAPELGASPIQLRARAGVRIRDLVVYLTPALDYTGVVLGAEGKPLAGATVRLLGAAAGEQALAPIEDRFTADARGEFIFHAPDDALLEARHPGYAPGRARLDEATTVTRRLEIRLDPGATEPVALARIRGRVLDARGLPLAGALVRAVHERGWMHPEAQATSDDAGRFSLEGLDPGEYVLTATQPGFAPASVPGVEAGATDVKVVLHPGAVLAGRVRGEHGAAVAAFTIAIARRSGPMTRTPVKAVSVIDSDGGFEVDGLEPGEYTVTASASGYAPSREAVGHAVSPPARDPIDLELSRGVTLSGKVVSARDGAPIPHARITIEGMGASGSSAMPVTASVGTDAQGRFELGGLAAGRRSVTVAAYQHHIRIVSGLVVVEGGTLAPIVVELAPLEEGEEPRRELVGIGVMIAATDQVLRIERVIADGGAAEAGLVPGDAIVAVDGARVVDLGFDQAMQHIRGPESSTVRLSVRKADQSEVELVVRRRRVRS